MPRFLAIDSMVYHYHGGTAPEVLILGDSVMGRVARGESEDTSLGMLFQNALRAKGLSSLVLSGTGWNPILFARIIEAVLTLPTKPQRIVVPVNLRCFSTQWYAHPEYQFTHEQSCLEHFIATGESPDLPVTPATQEDWETYDATEVPFSGNTVAAYTAAVACRPRTKAQERWRKWMIFNWHYSFVEQEIQENPQFCAMRDMFYTRTYPNGLLASYITPINYEAINRATRAISYVPECPARVSGISWLCDKVCNVLYKDSRRPETEFLCPSDMFFSRDDTTEHLNERGRRALVEHALPLILEGL